MPAPLRQALCCQCGALRMFRRARNHRQENWWLHRPVDADWGRELGDLKCVRCRRMTTHALLHDPANSWRDHAERFHDINIGFTFNVPDDAAERIREQYRKGRPQNPKLRHIWWPTEAEKARAAGQSEFAAICGDLIPLPTERSKKVTVTYRPTQFIPPVWADRDPSDGGGRWEWRDCVSCLKVANMITLENLRDELRDSLIKVAARVRRLDALAIERLLSELGLAGGET